MSTSLGYIQQISPTCWFWKAYFIFFYIFLLNLFFLHRKLSKFPRSYSLLTLTFKIYSLLTLRHSEFCFSDLRTREQTKEERVPRQVSFFSKKNKQNKTKTKTKQKTKQESRRKKKEYLDRWRFFKQKKTTFQVFSSKKLLFVIQTSLCVCVSV